MNPFLELNESFNRQEIGKQQMSLELAKITANFFDLSEYMKLTSIKQIYLRPDGVFFGIDVLGKEIKFKHTIDTCDLWYMTSGQTFYEEDELAMFLQLLKEKVPQQTGVVFDIGANMGCYSLITNLFRSDLTVYSFEPVPRTFSVLEANHKENHIDNNCLFNMGFSNIGGDCTFYENIRFTGASSLANLEYSQDTHETVCQMMRLDDFVEQNHIERIDMIKCDVEGAELLVLQGGLKTIQLFKPVIQLEMLRKWAAKFEYHPNDIIDLLGSYGYRCYVMENCALKPFGRVCDDTLETNYYFIND